MTKTKTFCGRRRKGYKSNKTPMKLGESKIIVDMNDFYYVKQAVEWEAERQVHKIKKDHICRLWIKGIKKEYSDDYTGLLLDFFESNSSYHYRVRLNSKSMFTNMQNAVERIVSRETEKIKSDDYGKQLSNDFKKIVKTDFKPFKLKMEYDDYAVATLPNGIEVKINRVFDKVELGYIPSNKINSLRIIRALSKVKMEKEIEEDDDE